MAKLKAYIPSVKVDLKITKFDSKNNKEVIAYDFKNLTYKNMTNKQIKEQQKGREDYFDLIRKAYDAEDTIKLLRIKLDSIKDTKENKSTRGKVADEIRQLKKIMKESLEKANKITEADPDKFKNIEEDEFKISIGGDDLNELIKVIESEEFEQVTYGSVLELLKEDAREKKGN